MIIRIMNIVVFGANGKVGSRVVARLLQDGHNVRAFVHSTSKLPGHPKLRVVQGDIHKKDDVHKAVNGSDAVISALGSWGTKSKDILTSGMEAIVPAMKAAKIKRIVSLTGAGARDSVDQPSLLDRLSRPLLLLVASRILHDGEQHIAILRASRLDWIVVRSPVMGGSGKTGYELTASEPPPWATIARHAVVDAMVRLVTNDEYNRTALFIRRA